MLHLQSSIKEITQVGQATARLLKSLEIETVQDLLFYFPFRYDDFSQKTLIKDLKIGSTVNLIGYIELIQNKRSPQKRINITEALVSDESGTVKIIWFNQPFITRQLLSGDKVSLSGKVEGDYSGAFLRSPGYEKIEKNKGTHTQGLVPNYHLTEKLTQKQIRSLISQVINLADNLEDWLPTEIKNDLNLINLNEAIHQIHFPQNSSSLALAKARLGFDEVFLLQLQSQIIRQENLKFKSTPIVFQEKQTKKLVASLPFKLTKAQKIAAWEILQDLQKETPMTRLLEGDVGSGKTIVAGIAMLNVALDKINESQSVLMAPTEILARQHFENLSQVFKDWPIKIGLLTHSNKLWNFEQTEELKKTEQAEFITQNCQIIIGTHALLQEKTQFKKLCLTIIDEQHRFGVDQRQALIKKIAQENFLPHLLSMTATPIPRSLALAIYGDLDVSILNEMPKNRKPIFSRIVEEKNRQMVYRFINQEIKKGRQAFVICPLIDFSDKMGVKSVKEEVKKLEIVFKDLRVEILHGKMKSEEKEKIMQNFLDNKINILVATSVIEVGVDFPNATMILIEGADRFGLAQLHQFRGRVGRSEYQSYCFLFSDNLNERVTERLKILVSSENGFDLAQKDLSLRGPGEFFGTIQKGFPNFKIASFFDFELMKKARQVAIALCEKDASLNSWPMLKKVLSDFNNEAHLE